MKIEHGLASTPITFDEFIRTAESNLNPDDPSTIWDMRHALAALCANPSEIWDRLLTALERRMGESVQFEQASYFLLHRCPRFAVRATVWYPESETKEVRLMENGIFAYDYPHNHNFDLLTSTCFGPGYETELFEIPLLDHGLTSGHIVPAKHAGRHRLEEGTALFYEARTDVHVQIPVDELSVAINLLPYSAANRSKSQYGFEVLNNMTLSVCGSPLNAETKELGAARMLGLLVANGHASPEWLSIVERRRAGSPLAELIAQIKPVAHDYKAIGELVRGAISAREIGSNYHSIASKVRERRIQQEIAA